MSTSSAATARTIDLPLPAEKPAAPRADEAPVAARSPRKKAPLVLGALVAVAAGVALYIYVSSRGKQSTDDAQVEGHVSTVAARVSGQVKHVLVTDDQAVKAGDVLVELDAADLTARRDAARADLAAARAGLHAAETQLALTRKQVEANLAIAHGGVAQAAAVTGSTQATIDQALADVDAAKSRVALAQTELDRSQRLADGGALPRSELDGRRATLEQAEAGLAQARARVVSAEANRSNSTGTSEAAHGRLLVAQTGPEQIDAAQAQVELAQAKVTQAQSALHQADLDLSYTEVRAEIDGVVAKRTVEPGQLVSPDRPLLALVDTRDTWVVANFKETQLADLRPGLNVKVSVDGLPGTFVATVESIQAGTGARFSLLPPDNASGNFTKVTQRVPVKIRIADRRGFELRPGTSADVTVYTE